MAQHLTTINREKKAIAPPLMMDPALREKLLKYLNKLDPQPTGPSTIASRDAPDPATRVLLEARKDYLKKQLRPASEYAVRNRIADWLEGYAVLRAIPDEAQYATGMRYVEAVLDVPEWAIAGAIKRFLNGPFDPRRPVPSVQEFNWAARGLLVDFAEEARRLKRVLKAIVIKEPELTPERRAEIVDDAWLNGARLSLSPAEDTPEARERKRAAKEETIRVSKLLIKRELEAHGIRDGLPHSYELRQKLVAMGARPDLLGGVGGQKDGAEP